MTGLKLLWLLPLAPFPIAAAAFPVEDAQQSALVEAAKQVPALVVLVVVVVYFLQHMQKMQKAHADTVTAFGETVKGIVEKVESQHSKSDDLMMQVVKALALFEAQARATGGGGGS